MEVIYSRCCGLDVHAKTVVACLCIQGEPSVPISLETLSPNSLMSRVKEFFNVSRLVIIIEARESIASKG